MRMCHFWVQNDPFSLNKKILVKTINITFIYLFTPFSVKNFLKILRVDPELRGWDIFGSKMAHLSQKRNFWEKLLILISSIYWPLSLWKIFKNSYNGWGCTIFGPKMSPFAQTNFFSKNLLINLVPIIYAYQHSKNKSQISVY